MDFIGAPMLLFMLLNPFLVILYLLDVVKKQSKRQFARNLTKAGFWSILVFSCFAVLGDFLFERVFQASFASFRIFGGVIFLIIGIQFVLKGTMAIDALRGDKGDVSGAIAMPILIGPGTISASVLIGERLPVTLAISSIALTVIASLSIMIGLKCCHDAIQKKRENLIERYIEISGRILALYIGTISIEMIMTGLSEWVHVIEVS